MTVEYSTEGYPEVGTAEKNRQHEFGLLMNKMHATFTRKIKREQENTEWMNTVLQSSQKSHIADIETIGRKLKELADEKEFCDEYEQAIENIRDSLAKGQEFFEAAKRTQVYVVVGRVNVEARNSYVARDAVTNALWQAFPNSRYSDIALVSVDPLVPEQENVEVDDPF